MENKTEIFICHSSRDKQTIRNILNSLPNYISRWIDEENIKAGDPITKLIKDGIRNCDLFLLFVSKDAIKSTWIKEEIALAIAAKKRKPYDLPFLIPILMPEVNRKNLEGLIPNGADIMFLRLPDYETVNVDKLASQIKDRISDWHAKYFSMYKSPKTNSKRNGSRSKSDEDLFGRVYRLSLWNALEDIAVKAVISGGVTSMTYFREAKEINGILSNGKNPSSTADLQATLSIITSFDSQVKQFLPDLECDLFYLGEETVYQMQSFREDFSYSLEGDILPGKEFFSRKRNSIRVIIDAIDGTSSFVRGVPFFCSSLAIFIEDQLRISAIYDPLHHRVYSGKLTGPQVKPEESSTANVWEVASGFNTDMKSRFGFFASTKHKNSIAVHFTRSSEQKLKRLINSPKNKKSMLARILKEAGTVYALNSGLLALAQISSCGLDAFINTNTNPWDVAAGEVLVKACGGKLTDFNGKSIVYDSVASTSVLCANNRELHKRLRDIVKKK